MAKRREEPARPYFDIRAEYDASRKAVDQALIEMVSTVRMAARSADVGELSRRFLTDSADKLERALHGTVDDA